LSAQSEARRTNQLFSAGASVVAIGSHRRRAIVLGITTIVIAIAYLTFMGLAAESSTGTAISVVCVWILLKQRARVVRWAEEPLERESIVRLGIGRWGKGDIARAAASRIRRYRRLVTVAIAFLLLIAMSPPT
jgi:hypothetical protein